MKLPNLNYKKVAIISACCLLFGIINSYLIFPKILRFMLKRVSAFSKYIYKWSLISCLMDFQNLQLKPGSQMRPMFDKIPFYLDFKIYVFNITNPEEVLVGKRVMKVILYLPLNHKFRMWSSFLKRVGTFQKFIKSQTHLIIFAGSKNGH